MMRNATIPLLYALFFLFYNYGKAQDSNNENIRTYTTFHIENSRPLIDGILDDDCWQIGNWSGDFTQWTPNEGATPSCPTNIKILYDDKNIYVAIRALDHEPEKISRKLTRRDNLSGDVVGITFDSYHDHRTGFEFDVTAAGQKIDMLMTNPIVCDFNWNAVWSCKTGLEDSAWVAEFEIPFSQLRYSNEPEQTWGLHVWRWIERFAEESDWEVLTKTGPGMIYQFGHLKGIKNLPKSKRIEIVPYVLGKLETFEKRPENPFAEDGNNWNSNSGFDAKLGLTSNFTADITINPDFGQVEADPSNMNLTAFETFFEEKRPFFLEGKSIFNYDFNNINLFYTRRIGQAPKFRPQLTKGEYIDSPENTSIISAVKISGKTSDGLSVGFMQSISNKEHADLYSNGNISKTSVEPLTNYVVARVQQDFNDGTTMLGGILTSTNRFINEVKFNFLPKNAFSGGIDLLHQWNEKEFYLDARLIGSTVHGDKQSISLLQKSSAHYFQRPDANHIIFNPNATNLSGHGGQIKIGKGSKGLWRYSTGISWRSPGLELNDLGFMHLSDIFNIENQLSYFVNKPVSIFRTYSAGITHTNNWNYGMDYLSTNVSVEGNFDFLNKWSISPILNWTSEALDTHILRGGRAMKVPEIYKLVVNFHTDTSKKLSFRLNNTIEKSPDNILKDNSYSPSLSYRPLNALNLSIGINYAQKQNELQYVSTTLSDNVDHYILGKLNQKTLGATFRVDYNLTPELSIQYYGSPFASIGRYSKFKMITDPKATNYRDRFKMLNPVDNNQIYSLPHEDKEYTSFNNPDFNFMQFRSNMVFRWEYKPASHIYLVWSNERTNFENSSQGSIRSAFRNISNSLPRNLFLIKINYWLSI